MVKNCAFLTLFERGDFVIDDEHAIAPLADLGWKVTTLPWQQTRIPWGSFDAVILRSTWDYWNDVEGFVRVLELINRESQLANSLDIVRWNLEKTYLLELEQKGVGIVPTLWPESLGPDSFVGFSEQLGSHDLVIKPVVGANGEDAYRVSPTDSPQRRTEIAACFIGRRAMVQRFMPRVLTEGEYSLFFFNGIFSHSILKTPARSEFRSQEERGAEIRDVVPEKHLQDCGQWVLGALPETPLYARIDFVRHENNDFRVMELELIEPSLYLRTDPGAPLRFARAIVERFDPVNPI